jgi:Na+-translocating ferredoxin:NAD+ oxidoreductase RnfC subunit
MHGDAGSVATHLVITALLDDDFDRAIESGVLTQMRCDHCTPDCRAMLLTARMQRAKALAARERYRARTARMQLRAHERTTRRGTTPATTQLETKQTLPAAAAAALARAKAKAAERGQR